MARSVRTELIGVKELERKLGQLGDMLRKANSQAARSGAEIIMEDANRNAPGPHIQALQSKRDSTEDVAVVDIGPDKDHYYYQFIEVGAAPHKIQPGRAARKVVWAPVGHWARADKDELGKATAGASLAFTGRKGLVITGSVQHPGVRARPFLRPAMARNRDAAQKRAGEVFLEIISKVLEK